MYKVLVLGNGVSRLIYLDEILKWKRPIWACNRAYIDFDHVITHLGGHYDVMQEAIEYRELHGCKWKIFDIEEKFKCDLRFRKDTGTTLIAEALTRGYEVHVCGFDLGGPDLYSPQLEQIDKSAWIDRWRAIIKKFGTDRIKFWGHDHLPYLMSGENSSKYAHAYRYGKIHIDSPEYRRALLSWDHDYDRIFANIPKAWLVNIGHREWELWEGRAFVGDKGRVMMPKHVALRYAKDYPRDFKVEDCTEVNGNG